jgi:hypothetical protein
VALTRRALLHTFAFAVYFRVLDEIVIVLADAPQKKSEGVAMANAIAIHALWLEVTTTAPADDSERLPRHRRNSVVLS